MKMIRKYLPFIVYAAMLVIVRLSDRACQFVFPRELLPPALSGLPTQLMTAAIIGILAPVILSVHVLGQFFGHPLAVMHRSAVVLGALLYGSIAYWNWNYILFSYRCPNCCSLRRKYMGKREESCSESSPDTVVTKRYSASGDYIGYSETEIGRSTVTWTAMVKRYKCKACGHEWSIQ